MGGRELEEERGKGKGNGLKVKGEMVKGENRVNRWDFKRKWDE